MLALLLACSASEKAPPEQGADHSAPLDDSASGAPPADSPPGESGAPADSEAQGETGQPPDTGDPAAEAVDYRLPGPEAWTSTTASFTTTSGCELEYIFVKPESWTTLVVLEHGMQREKEQMELWAEQWASWGLAVAVPTACHASIWDVDHEQNAEDMVELAGALYAGPVIYAGHSAGGLASFLAGALDPLALGALGFDPVEWEDLATSAAATYPVPAWGLLGEPGICNLDNNFEAIYALVPEGRALHVTEADHCDFEETDWLCTTACGTESNDLFSDAEIQATIAGLSTAFLLYLSDLEPGAVAWWTPGEAPYEALLASGAISE